MINESILKLSKNRSWIRKGLIMDRNTFDIEWLRLNVQLPIPISGGGVG